MATTKYSNGRRACTEMPENCEAIDLNNLPDADDTKGAADDCDDIDFQNYKGIYANDDSG